MTERGEKTIVFSWLVAIPTGFEPVTIGLEGRCLVGGLRYYIKDLPIKNSRCTAVCTAFSKKVESTLADRAWYLCVIHEGLT